MLALGTAEMRLSLNDIQGGGWEPGVFCVAFKFLSEKQSSVCQGFYAFSAFYVSLELLRLLSVSIICIEVSLISFRLNIHSALREAAFLLPLPTRLLSLKVTFVLEKTCSDWSSLSLSRYIHIHIVPSNQTCAKYKLNTLPAFRNFTSRSQMRINVGERETSTEESLL